MHDTPHSKAIAGGRRRNGSRWYASFYWRIGISFVVFLVAVIAAQGVMFSFVLARTGDLVPAWSPAIGALDVAADLGAALDRDPGLALDDYVRGARIPANLTLFVVMKDGRVAGTGSTAAEQRRQALRGSRTRRTDVPSTFLFRSALADRDGARSGAPAAGGPRRHSAAASTCQRNREGLRADAVASGHASPDCRNGTGGDGHLRARPAPAAGAGARGRTARKWGLRCARP